MKKLILGTAIATLLTVSGAWAETIKIGVTPGPHAQIMEKVKEVAKADDLDIEILEFSDYVIPNQALNDGDLDANSFQHEPYLDNQIADRKFDLVNVGNSVNFPMGTYSRKVKSLGELADGATVAIPNDPTNGGRALLLLADQGLIKIKDGVGLKATVADIVENSKNLKFAELDAAQLPRSLDDVDLSVINTNYALEAGMNPATDSIAREGEKAPYVNIIVVRTADKDKPWVAKLLKAYHNDTIKQYITDEFKGAVIAGW
ncbi:MAG: MetQ/NlpA family ABC transporter substrate-binding protein [Phyllobacterium sp.]